MAVAPGGAGRGGRDPLGEQAVAHRAAALAGGGADPALVEALAGRAGLDDLDRNPVNAYWGRVWGARALLYAWDDAVVPDVVAALADEHWGAGDGREGDLPARHRRRGRASRTAAVRPVFWSAPAGGTRI